MSGFFKSKSRKSFHELFSRSRPASLDVSKILAEASHDPPSNSSTPASHSETSNPETPSNGIESMSAKARKYFTRSRKIDPKSESRIVLSADYSGKISLGDYDKPNNSNVDVICNDLGKNGCGSDATQYGITQFIVDGYKPSPYSSSNSSISNNTEAPSNSNKREFVVHLNAREMTQFTNFHAFLARSFIRKGVKSIIHWKFPACRIKFLTPLSDESRLSTIGWHRTPGAILEYEHLEELRKLPLWVDGEEIDYNPESDVDMDMDDIDDEFDLLWGIHECEIKHVVDTDDF